MSSASFINFTFSLAVNDLYHSLVLVGMQKEDDDVKVNTVLRNE